MLEILKHIPHVLALFNCENRRWCWGDRKCQCIHLWGRDGRCENSGEFHNLRHQENVFPNGWTLLIYWLRRRYDHNLSFLFIRFFFWCSFFFSFLLIRFLSLHRCLWGFLRWLRSISTFQLELERFCCVGGWCTIFVWDFQLRFASRWSKTSTI